MNNHIPSADVDSRGPILNTGIHSIVCRGRVEAVDFNFSPQLIPLSPCEASWIWIDTENYLANNLSVVWFRKEIELPETPEQAYVWFSADAHARIYINGHLVARGPDDSGQDYSGTQTGKWFVNFRDLTSCFRIGKNIIAVEVFTAKAMLGRYNTSGKGGFLFEAILTSADGQVLPIMTDQTWKGRAGYCWEFCVRDSGEKKGSGYLRFDARAEPKGWRLPEFDSNSWPVCVTPPNHWPTLLNSEIPPRLEVTYPIESVICPTASVEQQGERITFSSDGRCVIRYDRVLSGFIGLKVLAKAGTTLWIKPNELNEPGFNRSAMVVLRDGEQSFELPFYDSFSVINIEASNVQKPLEILDVRANFVAQPVSYRGSFSCSDKQLNQIWEVSRWLTQICQQTHHLDSPHHQEPISDPGDYLIESLNNFHAFHQPYLARQDLRKYAWLLRATGFKPFHTSYALLWLQMLLDYTDYTGDFELIAELATDVYALLDQFTRYIGKNGIISEAPDYMFMDWSYIHGFALHHPPAVIGQGYMTAFYYRALNDGIRVAELLGESTLSDRYEKLRREIKEAYNRELWDEEKSLYRDGTPFVTSVKPHTWMPADQAIESHSLHNNTLAVLYDLAPVEHQSAIMRQLMQGDLNCQPYFMHFVFDALSHAGIFEEFAVPQMRRWQVVEDTQSFREMWESGDYSHAWQCTPLFQMSSKILGITPLNSGFEKISIAPQLCDLTWAKGTVPTPHGPIGVEWERKTNVFSIRVKIPEKSTATLKIPTLGMNAKLMLNGENIPMTCAQSSNGIGVSGGINTVVYVFDAVPLQNDN